MLGNRFRRKIKDLREQPEPVRMRAALLMTGVSGLALGMVWLTLLLPLQLRLNNRDGAPEVAQQSPPPAGQVGGIQAPAASPAFPNAFLPVTTPTPSPETIEPTLPVELLP